MKELKDFWDSLGWLANAIQILGAFGVVGTGCIYVKKFFNQLKYKKYKNIHDYVDSIISDKVKVMENIINKAKIAIVDDNSDDFPVDYLRKVGYKIDIYNEVSLTDASKLADYDIVLLDIVGVVKEDKKEGGLELIKRIIAYKDHANIIAVSGKKFDPNATDFFKLADDVMKKPISEKLCEDKLNNIIANRLSPCKASKDIDAYLLDHKLTASEYLKLNQELIKYLRNNINKDVLRNKLAKNYGINDSNKVLKLLDRVKTWDKGISYDS